MSHRRSATDYGQRTVSLMSRWTDEPMNRFFQLFYITDRTQIKSTTLAATIAQAIAAGVDWVQIREKDLPARSLLALTEAALSQARQQGTTRIVVNDRLDVALAAYAHG